MITENSNFCNICGEEQLSLPASKKSIERPVITPSARSRNKWIVIGVFIILMVIGGAINYGNEINNSSIQSSSQALFVLSGFSVTPDEVISGDSFQITVTVSNTGGSQGTYTLEVLVNDVQISSQNIRLSPNKAETIKFSHKTSEYGEYEVEVGEKSVTVLAVLKINAYELRAEYKANEVAADEKYEDKIAYVEGVIDGFGKTIADYPYITLDDGEYIVSVQCIFQKEHTSAIAALNEGQEVTIRGEISGMLGNIFVRKSSIINDSN